MAALTYSINPTAVAGFSNASLDLYFTLSVIKRLSISSTNALVNPNVVEPENAYS